MNQSSPRPCFVCKDIVDFQDLRTCSFCGTKGEDALYYCIRRCHQRSCRKWNCQEHPTCWEAHRAGILRDCHQEVDPVPQIYVNAVTYSEPDPAKQRELHYSDRAAQWFVVRLGAFEGDQARLAVSDRFRQLCDPGISGNRWTSSTYPSFVSFIGNTGTGKSTLVRAMMLMGQLTEPGLNSPQDESPENNQIGNLEYLLSTRMPGPVTRTANINHLMDPTSLGVHLYKDPTAPDQNRGLPSHHRMGTVTPILFADCEGFQGSISTTNSERDRPVGANSNLEELNPNLILDEPIISPEYGSHGKDGVELFYARFLYAFSDVVVFVTKEDQIFQKEMQRVLEWAAAAVDKSINHLAQKTLIIVRQMPTKHVPQFYENQFLKESIFDSLKPLWHGSTALADFMKRYNNKHPVKQRTIHTNPDFFKVFFHEVHAYYVPDKDKAPVDQIFLQYRRLRNEIVRASKAAQAIRAKSWTQYNIPTLSHLLRRAFEHFRVLDTPFDFFTAARKDNPNPVSVSDHIANLLRHTQMLDFRVTRKFPKLFPLMFPQIVSICLVSCAIRTFQQAWEPEEIFERDLRSECEKGIQIYCDRYRNCGFRFEGGLRCITRSFGHNEHCDEKGNRVSGNFDPSEYQKDSTRTVNEIQEQFIQIYLELCTNGQKTQSHPDSATIQQRREEAFETFEPLWKLTYSNKTCFTCLQSVPDHVLSCGHSYCPTCVKEFGQPSKYYEYGVVMDHCILCRTAWRDEHSQLIRLKPRCAGVRILTLDGGGVRGIMELAILEKLEARIGLEVPIREFFDLIVGTSTGGIISLGLVMTRLSAAQMKEEFAKITKETFRLRREGLVTLIDPFQITSKAFMLLRIYESIYRTGPLKQGLIDLFGENVNLFSSAKVQQHQRATRVAVTSTKDNGGNRCLIANYNRPDLSNGDDFEREDDDEKEMRVWEAGLATAAAPFYFRPFEKVQTMKNYVDGALNDNLPITCALEEMAHLWPNSDVRTSLDALVSIGTGIQKKEVNLPKIMEIGGFKQMCTSFFNNLNTERTWEKLVHSPHLSGAHRHKIHRLNAHITGDYVDLTEYGKMKDMADMVTEQCKEVDHGASELSKSITRVVDTLTASLFFFEPDPSSLAKLNYGDPTRRGRHELKGAIRCRLANNSQELKKLVNLLSGVCQREVPETTQNPDVVGWTEISLTSQFRSGIGRGAWFNLECTISTSNPADMLQVIAVAWKPPMQEESYYSPKPFPISGFPVSFNDLRRQAMYN